MMNLADARKILPLARELSGLIADDYAEAYNTSGGRAEICKYDPMTGEVSPIAALLSDATYDDRRFLAASPTIMRGLLRLLDEAFDIIRNGGSSPEDTKESERQPERSPDYARECAMKCENRLFRRYLIERTGMKDAADSLRVASHVREKLQITSRNELNINPEAAERWKAMRLDFNLWRDNP